MKWEYKIISVYSAIETFNKLGEDGWELVYLYDNEAYFKRPKDIDKKVYEQMRNGWIMAVGKLKEND